MITTLLWDIDGVFVDTEKLHFQAWQWLAQQFNKELTEQEYTPMMGRGSDENMRTFCDMKKITEESSKLQTMRRNKYAELRSVSIPVIEENVLLVREFKEHYPKLLQAAVSASRCSDIEENLRAAGLSNFFVRVISFEDCPGLKRKPAPDLYQYTCEMLKRSPEECLAFEDSLNGAQAAEKAGIKVVMLPTTLSPQEILGVYK